MPVHRLKGFDEIMRNFFLRLSGSSKNVTVSFLLVFLFSQESEHSPQRTFCSSGVFVPCVCASRSCHLVATWSWHKPARGSARSHVEREEPVLWSWEQDWETLNGDMSEIGSHTRVPGGGRGGHVSTDWIKIKETSAV